MKEQRKNHERKRNVKTVVSENFPPVTPFFQKKKDQKVESYSNTSQEYISYEKAFNSESYQEYILPEITDNSYHEISSSLESLDNYHNLSSSISGYEDHIRGSSKSEIEEQYEYEASQKNIRLDLNSPDDYKRAFVYSLIFDRKY